MMKSTIKLLCSSSLVLLLTAGLMHAQQRPAAALPQTGDTPTSGLGDFKMLDLKGTINLPSNPVSTSSASRPRVSHIGQLGQYVENVMHGVADVMVRATKSINNELINQTSATTNIETLKDERERQFRVADQTMSATLQTQSASIQDVCKFVSAIKEMDVYGSGALNEIFDLKGTVEKVSSIAVNDRTARTYPGGSDAAAALLEMTDGPSGDGAGEGSAFMVVADVASRLNAYGKVLGAVNNSMLDYAECSVVNMAINNQMEQIPGTTGSERLNPYDMESEWGRRVQLARISLSAAAIADNCARGTALNDGAETEYYRDMISKMPIYQRENSSQGVSYDFALNAQSKYWFYDPAMAKSGADKFTPLEQFEQMRNMAAWNSVQNAEIYNTLRNSVAVQAGILSALNELVHIARLNRMHELGHRTRSASGAENI